MSSLGEILAREQQQEALKRQRAAQPKGTSPGVDWDERRRQGTIQAHFQQGQARDWDAVLVALGFDPEVFEVDDRYPIEVRAWDGPIGEGVIATYQYVKAKLRLRVDTVTTDDLVKAIRRAKPRKPPRHLDSLYSTDILALSDWQIGKAGEDGGGTPETIERVIDMIGKFQDRRSQHKRLKVAAGRLILPGMGDLTERCQGNYTSQPYTTDLNEREQARTARWLLYKVIKELAPDYDTVIMGAVASNHGQNRAAGSRDPLTTHDDDSDLTLFESLAERLSENPDAWGHVHLHESPDPLVMTLDVGGTGVAFTHGHVIKGGVNKPVYRLWDWWEGQMSGHPPRPAGDCQVLVAAHYHHPYFLQQKGMTLYGCPALDGGSRWLTDATGDWSSPGTLTFTLDANDPLPRDHTIL